MIDEKMVLGTTRVLADVVAERLRQERKEMTLNDDEYNTHDWHAMIVDYAGWARRMGAMGNVEKARVRLVQVAALAVAAIESIDRFTELRAARMQQARDAFSGAGDPGDGSSVGNTPTDADGVRDQAVCDACGPGGPERPDLELSEG